ncbi:MAG: hypothetical protein Q7J32_05395 [Sphingomonadaceae bacterium]|nr:hypothetical protein [Sphingomonadaceae bacterium]
MRLKAGTKLKSVVCGLETIIIRPPSAEATLSCSAVPMTIAGEAAVEAPQLADVEPGHALVGKRYVDEASGLEVLCTKGGKGVLAFDGRPLTLKEAKPLPASD